MRYFYPILLFVLLVSCSKSDSKLIQTVENAIRVPILTYEKVDYKDIGSLGYPIKVIDVTFTDAEFNTLLNKTDLKGYTKEDGDYFRDFASDSINYHIAIFSKEYKIRYAEID